MRKPILISVYAVIPYKGKFLTIKRSPDDSRPGTWEIPGGGVDPGEDHYEALIREVKEEVGLNVNPKKVIDISSFETPNKYQIKLTFETELKTKNPKIKLSKEHDAFEWKPLETLEKGGK